MPQMCSQAAGHTAALSRGCCVKAQDSFRLDSSAASKFQKKRVILEQGPVVLPLTHRLLFGGATVRGYLERWL